MGQETEYALTVLGTSGDFEARARAARRLMRVAGHALPHLPGEGVGGLFLENGSRLYVDHGLHPELATPECSDPDEVLRYAVAGDLIVRSLVEEMNRRRTGIDRKGGRRVVLFKGNVDYVSGSTWGSHESQLYRCPWRNILAGLPSHLVTRIVYTGAGGFDNRHPGLRFLISPRVAHLEQEVSPESTSGRGILHARREPHASGGWQRLHLICGESLWSHRAIRLRHGTTALVVAMAEAGLAPSGENRFPDAPGAMHAFSQDPELRAEFPSAGGGARGALAIQRWYLEEAEKRVGEDFMPPWAEEVCRDWRAVLEALEAAPESLDTVLDWRIKYALYTDHARGSGFSWAAIRRWNEVLGRLQQQLDPITDEGRPLDEELLLSPSSPLAAGVAAEVPALAEGGLSWAGLAGFLALRRSLLEIDLRFSQLGQEGIFEALDHSGALRHRVPAGGAGGADREAAERAVEEARRTPPSRGRARLRGECVRRFAGDRGRYSCDWTYIFDRTKNRRLDLSDPFTEREIWSEPETDTQKRERGPLPSSWAGLSPRMTIEALLRELTGRRPPE